MKPCRDSLLVARSWLAAPLWFLQDFADITVACRYHSAKTLRTMNCYRIGRIEGPWINFTPPIRGGKFNLTNIESEESESDYADSGFEDDGSWSSASSVPDENPSLDYAPAKEASSEVSVLNAESDHQSSVTRRKSGNCEKVARVNSLLKEEVFHRSPEAYTVRVEQQEVDADLAKYPSLDAATQRNITRKYQELHQKIKDGGYYDCRYIEYGKECIRYSGYFVLFLIALRAGWYITSAALLGLFWHQIMFTAHDAGHMGITHNFKVDTIIGMFIADFCCGLSIGWWKSSHNVHHLVTNHPVCLQEKYLNPCPFDALLMYLVRNTIQIFRTFRSSPPHPLLCATCTPATMTLPSSGMASQT